MTKLFLIAAVAAFSLNVSAQRTGTFTLDSDGDFHTRATIRLGKVVLRPGMYRVYKSFVNREHFIGIRRIAMVSSWKGMGTPRPSAEIARFRCEVVPLATANRLSRLEIIEDDRKRVVSVQVRFSGESTQHVFSPD